MPAASAAPAAPPATSAISATPRPTRLVACLCAGWCTTCEAYRPVFAALAATHPEVLFTWVDVEDQADALEEAPGGAPDIQNFPTLLLAHGEKPVFLGTVLPHAAVLERMLAEGRSVRTASRLDPCAAGLVGVIRAMLTRGEVSALVG